MPLLIFFGLVRVALVGVVGSFPSDAEALAMKAKLLFAGGALGAAALS